MTARRTARKRGGWRATENSPLRFNRDFTRIGVGRITNSSRTTDTNEFFRRDHLLSKLADSGQSEVLRAFKRGDIPIEELVEADREGRLKGADLLAYIKLKAPLWDTIEAVLPRMGGQGSTRQRYEVSLSGALKRKAVRYLSATARVSDLQKVDWQALRSGWGKSAADWNHMRRALSAFLTCLLGDKFHPFRRSVVASIPIGREVGRVPDMTPTLFYEVLSHVPERYRACYVTLAATGLRVSEYLALTRFNLKPATQSIAGVGTKTTESGEDVAVFPGLWPTVERAVPCPITYKPLRRHWAAACRKVGISVRLHDLRHCYGQWAVNAGVPESKVQTGLRHKTASMTRRYTKTLERGEAANAVGRALLGLSTTTPVAQVAAQGDTHGDA